MKYMWLIHIDEQVLSETMRESTLAANLLHPTSTAIRVRVRDGKRLVTDGPFAETREQLGG